MKQPAPASTTVRQTPEQAMDAPRGDPRDVERGLDGQARVAAPLDLAEAPYVFDDAGEHALKLGDGAITFQRIVAETQAGGAAEARRTGHGVDAERRRRGYAIPAYERGRAEPLDAVDQPGA